MSAGVFARMTGLGVIPVVEIDDPADAALLAKVLVEAGLPVVEITLRTAAALEAVARAVAEVPECLVGAGTLLNPAMISAAVQAGAGFGVSPGVTAACLDAAAARGLPYVPGAVTPGEVMSILDAGLTHVKFFPAGAFGGLATLRALAGPFASTGVRFMPTGGVTEASAPEFLAAGSVFAVGGTWVAPRTDIAAHRWDAIGQRAHAAAALRSTTVA
jgi:2-dehydro-3-deoxyphosphogluconate aldolase/(4S)-4-hydroxy-2-oxoglutarate aldolase